MLKTMVRTILKTMECDLQWEKIWYHTENNGTF